MAKATKKECRDLRFRILRNIHYNVARRGHYAFWNRALNFVIILGGATALTDFVSQESSWRYLANFAVTVAGTVQLVFDCAGGVRTHETLQAEYSKVLSRLEAMHAPTSSDIAKLRAAMIDVGADEPPTFHAVDAVAYNETCDSIDPPIEAKAAHLKISIPRYLVRHFVAQSAGAFEPKSENRPQRSWLDYLV